MKIEKIKRWQWIVISLVVGFAIAQVRQMNADIDYGNTMNTQQQFETALLREENGIRWFKELIVYPHPTKRNKERPYYVVAGKYYSGRPERQSDGTLRAIWRPYCFIEFDGPYKPILDLRTLNKPGGPDYAQQFNAIENPTVLDFLKIMQEARGINFKFAWWAEPRNTTLLWVGGSFVLIGLIWPTVVSLLTFGTLTPPPPEDSIDLSKIASSSSSSAPQPKPSGPTEQDMDQLQQMEQKLMADLASRSDAAPAQAAPGTTPPATPQPVRQLTATQLEVTATHDDKEQKEFAAKEDDFYPTERHARPKPGKS